MVRRRIYSEDEQRLRRRERDKARRRANVEKSRASCRSYYLKHREQILARVKRYRQEDRPKNPDKYRKRVDRARPMSRAYNLKCKYGITEDDYRRMLDAQSGGCAVCGAVDPGRKGIGSFCVDHCHATGRVRGLLCVRCNAGIGQFLDNVLNLERAIQYLKKQ